MAKYNRIKDLREDSDKTILCGVTVVLGLSVNFIPLQISAKCGIIKKKQWRNSAGKFRWKNGSE